MRNKKLIVLFSILSFVTLLVVLSSVCFSVQKVYAYCYNDYDETLNGRIESKEVNGISRGGSIFMLNEKKITAKIENELSEVKVINIERKFPNQVYINYVKILPYIVLDTESDALLVSNECEVLRHIEKQEHYLDYIKLLTDTNPESDKNGDKLFKEDSGDYMLVSGILDTIERMDLHSTVVEMFEFIDTRLFKTDNLVYIKTRIGTYIELMGNGTNIDKQVQLAVSLYLSSETKYMTGGTITVAGLNGFYSDENKYEKHWQSRLSA